MVTESRFIPKMRKTKLHTKVPMFFSNQQVANAAKHSLNNAIKKE